ncbi:hypothetical protein [uncultured Alsobacter sp.]|uniref:hypothetical protein n=1 Tax=uncultured Alsobacter sp. TaxID=1748258 RepID=UPI0025EAE218|nr:hypothetical protein [uncultured Alsobacter sp.]
MSSIRLSIVSSATANRGGVPIWLANPEVRGRCEVDRKLSARIPPGAYVYTPTLDYARPVPSWQWNIDGVPIPGATDPIYVPAPEDEDKEITVSVTLKGAYASAVATSGSTVAYYSNTPGSGVYADVVTSNVVQANSATTTINLATTGGWKTSKTTGSMTAGSPTLTVADATNFSVGDQVIVENTASYGSMGVGGAVPALYYADATARDADTSKATNTRCWLQSTGRVFRWNGSAWVADRTSTNDPIYYGWAMPKALVATITAKSGNTLTLNKDAVVSITGANVYFDCLPLAAAYFSIYSGAVANRRLYLPTGEYAFSDKIEMLDLQDCFLFGDGRTLSVMFSPAGCWSFNIRGNQCHRTIFRNFGYRGSHRLNSWILDEDGNRARGIHFELSFDLLFDNLRSDETMNDAITLGANCGQSAIRSCYARFVTPIRSYFQWTFNTADTTDNNLIDCEVNSDYMIPAIECFRSDRVNIIRFKGRNAMISTNTSGGFLIDKPYLRFSAGCFYEFDPDKAPLSQNAWWGNPFININTNIGNTSGSGLDLAANGGSVVDADIEVEGYMDATYKVRGKAIIVAPSYGGVMVRGGRIKTIPYVPGDSIAWGIGCDGDSVTTSMVRFEGFTHEDPDYPNAADWSVFHRFADTDGHGRVFACVGEQFKARVKRRNRTNAQYISDGGI